MNYNVIYLTHPFIYIKPFLNIRQRWPPFRTDTHGGTFATANTNHHPLGEQIGEAGERAGKKTLHHTPP